MSVTLGKEAEDRASSYLLSLGYSILQRNFHSKFGEIDIIAMKNGVISFCEVKYSEAYDPLERITPSKMQKILKTIDYFFLKNGNNFDYEIDAIVVRKSSIEMIKNISY